MRFRLGHPDYPILDFYLTTPNDEVRQEVNRLGPVDIIAYAYDWPKNEYPYRGWTDVINRLDWPRDGDQFASCFLLIDDRRAELIKAVCDLQFMAADGPNEDDHTSILTGITSAVSVIHNGGVGDPGTDLARGIVEASAQAQVAQASGYTSGSLAEVDSAATATTTKMGEIAVVTGTGSAPRPYLILQAMLAPKEGANPPEYYAPAGMTLADVSETEETELMAWKLYPLPPVRLPDPDGTDPFPGLWLLPLVDLRYFWRLGPLGSDQGEGSSSSGDTIDPAGNFPVSDVNPREEADWMPELVTYPDDVDPPGDFTPIIQNGTNPAIASTSSRGWAADMQAWMQNWRIVNRDVRSEWNGLPDPHSGFTGILCDYPDSPSAEASYHLDAIRLAAVPGSLIDGGPTDPHTVRDLVPRKIRVLFRIINQTSTYEVDVYPTVDEPQSVSDLEIDEDGPTTAEARHLPKATLGVLCMQESPDDDTKADLHRAARQWVLLYYLWRRNQVYFKFAGIAPVIPNGHAAMITWDFATDRFSTTYVGVGSFEGTPETGQGGSDGAAAASGDGDNTAFVLVVSSDTIEERYPVVRMKQVGLPRDWTDLEPAWAFNVIEGLGLQVNEKYLCHRNLDEFLGLDQWATRDCCEASESDGSPPGDHDCALLCCPNDSSSTVNLLLYSSGSDNCPACLPLTVELNCSNQFGHFFGEGSCTSGECTLHVSASLQCISCANPPIHQDCMVDCTASAYYWCLHYRISISGPDCTCAVEESTGHISWSAEETDCPLRSIPKIRTVCGCDFVFVLNGLLDAFNSCALGLVGNGLSLGQVPLFMFGTATPCTDELTCPNCFDAAGTIFILIWDQAQQRWEGGFSLVSTGGCRINVAVTAAPGPTCEDVTMTYVWALAGDCPVTTFTEGTETVSSELGNSLCCPCTVTTSTTLTPILDFGVTGCASIAIKLSC